MPAAFSLLASRSRHALVAWLLGVVLVLQLAAPVAGMPRSASDASLRLAALAKVVGHAVATCHDDDGGQMPARDQTGSGGPRGPERPRRTAGARGGGCG